MVVYKAQRLLDSHLSTFTPATDIAYPNVQYTPKADTAHIRPTVMPAFLEDATIDRTGYRRQELVYQIDIYTPLNKGTLEAQGLAEAMVSLFARNTVLEDTETKIRVDRTTVDFTMREEDFWRTMISVYISSVY